VWDDKNRAYSRLFSSETRSHLIAIIASARAALRLARSTASRCQAQIGVTAKAFQKEPTYELYDCFRKRKIRYTVVASPPALEVVRVPVPSG
jgi:hypothetical protein